MTPPGCSQIFRAIVTGSLRAIHLLGLLVLLVLSIVVRNVISHLNSTRFIDLLYNQSFGSFISTISWIDLCIIVFGIVAALFQHKPTLRAFAYSACLAASLFLAYALCGSVGFYSGAKQSYVNQLVDNQTLYDWQKVPAGSSDPELEKRRLATIGWDDMQGTMCCGIRGSADWNKFRPANLPARLFPRSCCAYPRDDFEGVDYCTDDKELYKAGCVNKSDDLWFNLTSWQTILSVIQLALGGLAWYMAHDGRDSSPQLTSISQQQIVMDYPRNF